MRQMDAVTMIIRKSATGETQLAKRILKVFLQEVATGRYYDGSGIWLADTERAYDFRSGSDARECAERLGLSNVRIVIMQELWEREAFSPSFGFDRFFRSN